MAEAASLIPWGEQKVIRLFSLARAKHRACQRLREYEQFLQWTESSLQVSTAFDWGHTCEIAQAISRSATELFGGTHGFTFTSRTLLSKSFGEPIDSDLWIEVIKRLITSDASLEDVTLHSHYHAFRPGRALTFDQKLAIFWFLSDPDFKPERTGHHHVPTALAAISRSAFDAQLEIKTVFDAMKADGAFTQFDSTPLREKIDQSEKVTRLVQHIFILFYSSVDTTKCCHGAPLSRRRRALQIRNCKGPQVSLNQTCDTMQCSEQIWRTIRNLWANFICSWDIIVSKASGSFSFPTIPGIAELVVHDMATGYIASSKMLRTGAKNTDGRGTTIVHPSERAAVVSSDCQLISMRGSAIDTHGLRRRYTTDAKEFARYAILRCDLVKPARMNFADAIRDWNSTYTKWDRCPARLSQWTNPDLLETAADDYRIVLLRQALGSVYSIGVRSMPGITASAFGGFLQVAADDNELFYRLASHNKAIIVDQPLALHVEIVRPGSSKFFFIKDTWEINGLTSTRRDGRYCTKRVVNSGRPGVFLIEGKKIKRKQWGKRYDVMEQRLVQFA